MSLVLYLEPYALQVEGLRDSGPGALKRRLNVAGLLSLGAEGSISR